MGHRAIALNTACNGGWWAPQAYRMPVIRIPGRRRMGWGLQKAWEWASKWAMCFLYWSLSYRGTNTCRGQQCHLHGGVGMGLRAPFFHSTSPLCSGRIQRGKDTHTHITHTQHRDVGPTTKPTSPSQQDCLRPRTLWPAQDRGSIRQHSHSRACPSDKPGGGDFPARIPPHNITRGSLSSLHHHHHHQMTSTEGSCGGSSSVCSRSPH